MNMFKPTTAKTISEYFDLISEPRKSEVKQIHELIKKTVPSFKPYIQSSMLGYGKYHYRSSSGREGEWPVIGLASQKNYISVYVCCVVKGRYLAETYKPKFPKASIGKSCIRFKKLADIDLKVLKQILLEAKKYGGMNAVAADKK